MSFWSHTLMPVGPASIVSLLTFILTATLDHSIRKPNSHTDYTELALETPAFKYPLHLLTLNIMQSLPHQMAFSPDNILIPPAPNSPLEAKGLQSEDQSILVSHLDKPTMGTLV